MQVTMVKFRLFCIRFDEHLLPCVIDGCFDFLFTIGTASCSEATDVCVVNSPVAADTELHFKDCSTIICYVIVFRLCACVCVCVFVCVCVHVCMCMCVCAPYIAGVLSLI